MAAGARANRRRRAWRMWGSVGVLVWACLVGAAGLAGLGAASSSLGGCVFYLNPQCNDQIKNGEETDVDCGGGESGGRDACSKCDIGDSCKGDGDCFDGTCERGACTPFACANGVRDEAETDIDCGGMCRKCAGARGCASDADCFSGTCDPGSLTCASLRQVSFDDGLLYPSGQKAYVIFAGDLDGDGFNDLVVANELESTVQVFRNDGAGRFPIDAPKFPTGDYPTGGALVDFNHDGTLDVVTADYHGNSVSILLNTGGGTLGAKTSYPTVAGAETSNLAVGDLDGDGNPDVVAVNPQNASVSEFIGLPAGTLRPAVTTAVGVVGNTQPYSVALGDFDHKFGLDMAIGDLASGPLIVRLRAEDGSYQDPVLYNAGVGPNIVITADLDLDGNLDLVVANRNGSTVSSLMGRGDGTFKKAVSRSTGPMSGPYTLSVADFNQDGVPDVATANYLSANVTVLLGTGDGRLEAAIDTGRSGNICYGVATADLDGDDKPDIAAANSTDNVITVKLNTSQ